MHLNCIRRPIKILKWLFLFSINKGDKVFVSDYLLIINLFENSNRRKNNYM